MPTGQHYATNVPQTTLQAGGVNATAPSCTVQSSVGWPATPFTAFFDLGQSNQEPVDVTNVSGNVWTITRAIDGTTGLLHSNGATVTHGAIGRDFTEARTHIDAGTNVHGLTGGAAVVGDIQAQTLTNKTLTAPVISTISNTGTLTLPSSTDTLVGRATTDTLTNKTLTSPHISSIINTGTLTLPTSTDTLVGRATADTLTNKTLTSPTINSGTINNTSVTGTFALSGGNQLDLTGANATSPITTPALNTWACTLGGTSVAIGNGIITAQYIGFGHVVFFSLKILRGSTTNLGTGATALTFTLPVTAAGPASWNATFVRPASSDIPLYAGALSGSLTLGQLEYLNASTTLATLANTLPAATSTGDYIMITGWYPV